MSDPIELPVSGLDTLAVPEPGADFWARVRADLAAASAPTSTTTTTTTTTDDLSEVRVHDLDVERERRRRRPLLAVAAVLVLVVGGLVAVRFTRPEEQVPADRVDVVITDPNSIDLDGLRREEFGWEPNPIGPYGIFDLSTLDPATWTVVTAGYDIRDTRATWDWRWEAMITRPSSSDGYRVEITAPETGTVALPRGGSSIEVRGTEGVIVEQSPTAGEITWIEQGSRVKLAWSGVGRTSAVAFAEGLEAGVVDRFAPAEDLGGDAVRTATATLGGRIDGVEWRLDPALEVDGMEQVAIVVDGTVVASGGDTDGRRAMTITVGLPFAAGRFSAGRVPGVLASAVAELSDGTTVTVPVAVHDDSTSWAMPIPIGLDVTRIRLLAADGKVARTISVPVYLDLPGAQVSFTD